MQLEGGNSNSTRDREYIQYVGLDRSTRLLRRLTWFEAGRVYMYSTVI